MQPAKDELQAAIEKTTFKTPKCPVYQNVNAKAVTNPDEIKENLMKEIKNKKS
jgi:[acyl-carrier-protein] S-malonyltransferase